MEAGDGTQAETENVFVWMALHLIPCARFRQRLIGSMDECELNPTMFGKPLLSYQHKYITVCRGGYMRLMSTLFYMAAFAVSTIQTLIKVLMQVALVSGAPKAMGQTTKLVVLQMTTEFDAIATLCWFAAFVACYLSGVLVTKMNKASPTSRSLPFHAPFWTFYAKQYNIIVWFIASAVFSVAVSWIPFVPRSLSVALDLGLAVASCFHGVTGFLKAGLMYKADAEYRRLSKTAVSSQTSTRHLCSCIAKIGMTALGFSTATHLAVVALIYAIPCKRPSRNYVKGTLTPDGLNILHMLTVLGYPEEYATEVKLGLGSYEKGETAFPP